MLFAVRDRISRRSRQCPDFGPDASTAFRPVTAGGSRRKTVEIRSQKFGGVLNGRTAQVKTIYLMYDMAGLDAASIDEIMSVARGMPPNVKVTFSDGQRIYIPDSP
jgi:hypothetical protein